MINAIEEILNQFSDEISSKCWSIEGFDLSYVDNKNKHIEIFSFSTDRYYNAISEGFTKPDLGSLLQSENTFTASHIESIYEIISTDKCNYVSECKFRTYHGFFSGQSNQSDHSNWIKYYKEFGLSGVYFSKGKRRKGDFDLVLFGIIKGDDNCDVLNALPSIVDRFIENLNDFAIVFENLRQNRKSVIEQATRAAISQVMARNTSHNIGAHVMNKLIGDLSKLKFHDFKNYKSDITLYDSEKTDNEILLDQISIFNNYVKCRMDYLADISFGTPLMQTNKYAYADLFKELDKVRLLLEHISGLDKFEFKIKFQKNGVDLNESNDLLVAIPNDILGTQAFYNILENIIRNSAKHAQKPVEKDENGNLINKSTVFTVKFIDSLEVETNGETKRVFDYCECSEVGCTKAHKKEIENALNEFIAVEVYDNIPVDATKKPIKLEDKEIAEYKRLMGNKEPNFDTYIDYLVFKQNNKLNEDILQENKLRSYSLGLIEMDASAAYLRKLPVEFINHLSYDIQYDESWSRNTEKNEKDKNGLRGTNCRHFLKAFKKVENGKNYLGYRFFLHRPAVVLVVTELLKDDKEKKEKLRKEGIWVVTKEEFENELKDGKVYPHEFVVIDSNVNFDKLKVEIAEKDSEGQETKRIEEIEFLEYYKTSFPIRVLNTISNLAELLTKSGVEIENKCWGYWSKNEPEIHFLNGYLKEYPDSFQAIFLDHLYSPNNKKSAEEYWKENVAANHLEALSSLAQSKMPDYNKITSQKCIKISEEEKKFQCYLREFQNEEITSQKIKEAILSKIIVIDERIQEVAETRDFMNIPYKCLYAKMNVRVPDKSIDLSASSYTEKVIEGIERYIISQTKESLKTDFILIHYSILERMYQKEKIQENLKRLLNNSPINVVFTSGRGTPDNLSADVRFVNLSSVINAFVDVRSKYAINYLVNSSRKSNKI